MEDDNNMRSELEELSMKCDQTTDEVSGGFRRKWEFSYLDLQYVGTFPHTLVKLIKQTLFSSRIERTLSQLILMLGLSFVNFHCLKMSMSAEL